MISFNRKNNIFTLRLDFMCGFLWTPPQLPTRRLFFKCPCCSFFVCQTCICVIQSSVVETTTDKSGNDNRLCVVMSSKRTFFPVYKLSFSDRCRNNYRPTNEVLVNVRIIFVYSHVFCRVHQTRFGERNFHVLNNN